MIKITQKNQKRFNGKLNLENPYPTRLHTNTSRTDTNTETQIVLNKASLYPIKSNEILQLFREKFFGITIIVESYKSFSAIKLKLILFKIG